MNLSVRLVILCAVAVLPAAAIQLWSELTLRSQRSAEVHAEAERASLYAASEIDRIVQAAREVLATLAQAPSVVARDAALCSGYIAELQRYFPAYSRIAVADPQGRLTCAGGEVPAGLELGSLPYFQEARRSGEFVIGHYMIGRVSGRPVLPLALPVAGPDGEVARVAVAALDLGALSARLSARGLPPGGSVTVADREGTIVARAPFPERFVGTRIPEGFRHLLHAPRSGALEVVSQDGTRRVLGYVPVGQVAPGLYVSAGISSGVAFALIDRSTWFGVMLIAAGVLSAALAAVLAGRLVIAPPVRRLLAAMRRWQEGDTAARVGRIGGGTELTRLADGFDAMADVLEARSAALRDSEEWLRLAQQAGGVGAFNLDLTSRRSVVSPGLLALHGLPPEAAAGFDYERWLSLVHPEDRARVDAETRAGLWTGEAYRNEYRIRRADTGAVRWLQVRSRREAAGPDRGPRVLGVNIDVTERREAEDALRASEERLRLATEAAGLGIWELEVEGMAVRWSPELFALFGLDPSADGPMTSELSLVLVHPDDRATLRQAWAEAIAGGSFAAEFRGLRRGAGGTEERWFLSRGRLLESRAGRVMVGVNLDITERRRAEERLLLLAREVDHRAKNALAVVQAAIRLAPRDDPVAFVRAVEGRVAALARAQVLLAEGHWHGATLRSVAEGTLAPFRPAASDAGSGPRVEIQGPEVTLAAPAVQPVTLALHELATNAAKYGALSSADGRLRLAWTVDRDTDHLRLSWEERGGPPVAAPPARRGFGSRVLQATIRDQLGGLVEQRWCEGGLVCSLSVPLARAFGAADVPDLQP